VATSVSAPGDASWPSHRPSGDRPQTDSATVDVAKGWDYQQTLKFGLHGGSPELVHGPPSITVKLIGHPAPAREFELIIMVEVMAE